jgi:hypothetical protein
MDTERCLIMLEYRGGCRIADHATNAGITSLENNVSECSALS